MRRDEGSIKREFQFALALSPAQSSQQRRPRRIRRIARRWNSLLVAAGYVNCEQRRACTATGIAEEHHHAPVRRPGRAFVVITVSENPLAETIRPQDPDGEPSLRLFRERDVVAARRPDRCRVSALVETDALCRTAIRAHHIDLLTPAAIGLKTDSRSIRR